MQTETTIREQVQNGAGVAVWLVGEAGRLLVHLAVFAMAVEIVLKVVL